MRSQGRTEKGTGSGTGREGQGEEQREWDTESQRTRRRDNRRSEGGRAAAERTVEVRAECDARVAIRDAGVEVRDERFASLGHVRPPGLPVEFAVLRVRSLDGELEREDVRELRAEAVLSARHGRVVARVREVGARHQVPENEFRDVHALRSVQNDRDAPSRVEDGDFERRPVLAGLLIQTHFDAVGALRVAATVVEGVDEDLIEDLHEPRHERGARPPHLARTLVEHPREGLLARHRPHVHPCERTARRRWRTTRRRSTHDEQRRLRGPDDAVHDPISTHLGARAHVRLGSCAGTWLRRSTPARAGRSFVATATTPTVPARMRPGKTPSPLSGQPRARKALGVATTPRCGA